MIIYIYIYVYIYIHIYIYKFILYINIYTNLPVYGIVRLPHPRSRHSQGNIFSTLCWQTNPQLWHRILKPPSLSINLKVKVSCSKIKWWAIYIYIYIYIYKIWLRGYLIQHDWYYSCHARQSSVNIFAWSQCKTVYVYLCNTW